MVAVGLWLGGLLGLVVNLRGEANEATARMARRFSRLATIGIAAVAVTGLLRAISEVGTIDNLVSTGFGLLVIGKTVLLGVLALLGAVNHFRHVPAAGTTVRGLRRIGSTELLVGATVLLLSASLVNLAPPTETNAGTGPVAPVNPVSLIGSDFGTSVKVVLEVTPGAAGFNTFKATVTDYDSGAPLASATSVSLRFSFPGRADVGSSRLDLPATAPGVFSATGSNLSLVGAWQVTALVVNGTASVEVPFELITRTAPATIDVNAVAGLPTIYTVHLSAGRSVQVYLDPGTAGANEVHATFFDADRQRAAGGQRRDGHRPVGQPATSLGPASARAWPLCRGHDPCRRHVHPGGCRACTERRPADDPARPPRHTLRHVPTLLISNHNRTGARSFALVILALVLAGCGSAASSPPGSAGRAADRPRLGPGHPRRPWSRSSRRRRTRS